MTMLAIQCLRDGKPSMIEGEDMGRRLHEGAEVYMTRFVIERRADQTLEFYSVVAPEKLQGRNDFAGARWEADCANLAGQGITEARLPEVSA